MQKQTPLHTMTNPKTRHWLLAAAALLALPVIVASWWMLSGGEHGEQVPKADRMDDTRNALTTAVAAPETKAGLTTVRAVGTGAAQGDAGDLLAYAEGLRAQGHPENTVRELVASRITAAYEGRRTGLRREARRAGADLAGIQAQLDALGREQGAFIAQLVGAEPAPEVQATAQTEPVDGKDQVLMPAVMADAMPATVKTEEQAASWAKLRDAFVNAVGVTKADPASPQYRRHWVQAQSAADQEFRLMFGDNAYVQHQMQAQHEATLRQQGLAK